MLSAIEMAELRFDAESEMTDTFAAFAPAAPLVDVNQMKQPGWTPMGTTLGKTRGSIARDSITRTVRVGGVEYDVVDGGVSVPLSQFIVGGRLILAIGWELQCIATGPAVDAGNLGRRWHVVNVPTKSWASARRLDVVEVPALTLD